MSNWNGGTTLPLDVSMYVYLPDRVALNPPVLTLIHFCGGSAQAVFGQAQGGGIVSAADQYGFIIVVPSNADAAGRNGRCWDISSTKTQTRDGGGDSHAIMQMVRYAIAQNHANANRVYSTGDSSGAMMSELLLALYPDVYKAGAVFAGVPAGCSNAFDASGLCGRPAQTAQQWGDRVRAMYPGYSGHRPRVQLFHGDADSLIVYKNLGEAIKEWTNILGLSADPTSTDNSLTLGTNPAHPATRQSWKNSCGYTVLDAFTEHKDPNKSATDPTAGGDHGPSDTLFVSRYVLPFLGLDSQTAATAAVDPEIAQCMSDGGAPTSDASRPDGGRGGSGGNGNGGASGIAGSQGSDGGATGGVQGTGGATGSGGAAGGSGGTSSDGGAAGDSTSGGEPSGCSCVLGGADSHQDGRRALFVLGLALAAALARRRRSRR
ncbi:MAG TPA: PHB depolymerase family esterase [Polyangia bacterium]|nr:PHB depolymerase family esterase [Polyangia bacterium]